MKQKKTKIQTFKLSFLGFSFKKPKIRNFWADLPGAHKSSENWDLIAMASLCLTVTAAPPLSIVA